jgi:hypothetical protein
MGEYRCMLYFYSFWHLYCIYLVGEVVTLWSLLVLITQVHRLVETAPSDLSSDNQWKVRQKSKPSFDLVLDEAIKRENSQNPSPLSYTFSFVFFIFLLLSLFYLHFPPGCNFHACFPVKRSYSFSSIPFSWRKVLFSVHIFFAYFFTNHMEQLLTAPESVLYGQGPLVVTLPWRWRWDLLNICNRAYIYMVILPMKKIPIGIEFLRNPEILSSLTIECTLKHNHPAG